jgi:molybdopterin converting factor small subunit
MKLLSSRRTEPIRVKLHVRAFIDGRMLRVATEVDAQEGDRLKDLLKQLRRNGTVDSSVVRQALRGNPAVMVLRNGERLTMPGAVDEVLADGDEVSLLTPMAGG